MIEVVTDRQFCVEFDKPIVISTGNRILGDMTQLFSFYKLIKCLYFLISIFEAISSK